MLCVSFSALTPLVGWLNGHLANKKNLYHLPTGSFLGLGTCALDSVFNTIVLNKILYDLPVYFGYLAEGHKDRLSRVLKRANRMGFTFHGHDLDHLSETSEYKLCCHSWSEQHCLYCLSTIKSRPLRAMCLRQRGHDFVYRNIRYEFNKRHFIAHLLFNHFKLSVFVLYVFLCITRFYVSSATL